MQHISAMAESVKTAVNPFTRLVNAATENDGSTGISYYQSEQVKEAAHQSDYACEWVHKALVARLDNASPLVQYKSLWLIRLLLLEGPGTFAEKMGSRSTGQSIARIHFLSTQAYPDPFKNSIEESIKNLAAAVHASITGAGHSVLNNIAGVIGVSSAHSSNAHSAAPGGASGQGKFKSAFHQEQVKELRNWRKRREEERQHGVVIQDKNNLTFNPQLTAPKLIEAVLQADKKKFSAEEVFSFVEAAMGNTKPVDVCALMEKVIAEPRYNIAQRHKMLQMVEGLVMTQGTNETNGAISEIGAWWQGHTVSLAKCNAWEDAANPAKAKVIQETARRVLEHLGVVSSTNPPGFGFGFGGGEQQQQQQQHGFLLTANLLSSGSPPVQSPSGMSTVSFSSTQTGAPGPHSLPGSPAFTIEPQQQPQRSRGASQAQAQTQQQQQQQQQHQYQQPAAVVSSSANTANARSRGTSLAFNNNNNATSGGGWQPTFGMTNINPIFAMDSNSNSSNQGNNGAGGGADMFGGLSLKKTSQPQPQQQLQQQVADVFASPVVPLQPQAAAANNNSTDVMRALQEQFQKNMAMMAQLQSLSSVPPPPPSQQQQRPPPGSWGSSVFAPPPIPISVPQVAVVAPAPFQQHPQAHPNVLQQQQQQQKQQQEEFGSPMSPPEPTSTDTDEGSTPALTTNSIEHDDEHEPAPVAPLSVWESQQQQQQQLQRFQSHSNSQSQNATNNNSFTNLSPMANSSSTTGVPLVPNNSFVDPNFSMSAMQQQMNQVQQLIHAQQQQQLQQQQLRAASSEQQHQQQLSGNNTPRSVGGVSSTHGGGGVGASSVRSTQDAELIALLQQQLTSAQQQITQQNQMMQMMQQQIQMLMLAAQQK